MRLLYFGDKHERVTAPENRMENDVEYVGTQAEKTSEIIEIGTRYNVSGFLQPGDFWDSPNPPLDFASDVIQRWTNIDVYDVLHRMMSQKKIDKDLFINDYLLKIISGDFVDIDEARTNLELEYTQDDFLKDKKEIEHQLKNYIPIVGVAGNHELFGNNIKTLPKTMLGFMEKLGLMHFATKEKPYFFYTEDGAKVAITGTHYHLDIDTPEHLDDYIVEEKLGDYHIHIVHGYLTDKSKGTMFNHTLIDHIKHTKADLTISGHDHIGFPLTEVDGKLFVNTGAIPRMSNDLKEIKRSPQVMLLDITKANGIKVQMIPLKSAQKGEIVLNRRKIIERKKSEERLEGFKKAVRDAGVKKSTDITQIIRDLSELKRIPIAIRDDIIDRISSKQREMNYFLDGVVKEAYVSKIVLENFQSHGFTEIECSKGLNIFVGESRQGKTAIFRAFEWVYVGKPAGKRIIKKGADYAKVTVYLSNGYIISRYIERKSSGKNGYIIVDPTTGQEEYHNTKILPEVQKLLGYTPFVIDNDLQFNLNFMKQGSGWFLIGDQYTAPVKAKIIGGIYGTQYTDAVSRELDAEEKKVSEVIRDAQGELVKVEEQIASYDYLEELGGSIETIEKLLREIDELNNRKEKIVSLVQKRKQVETIIQENQEIIEQMKGLERANLMLEQCKLQQNKRNQLASLVTKRTDLEKKYGLLQESLDALKHIGKASELYQEVVLLHRQGSDIRISWNKRKRVLAQIAEENEVISRSQHIEQASELFQEVQSMVQQRKVLVEKAERAKRLEDTRKDVAVKLNLIEETIEKTKHLEEANKLLLEIRKDIDRKANIDKVLVVRKRLKEQAASEDTMIKKQNNEIAILINRYRGLLEKAGSCPVCHGTIDKITVERIVSQYAVS